MIPNLLRHHALPRLLLLLVLLGALCTFGLAAGNDTGGKKDTPKKQDAQTDPDSYILGPEDLLTIIVRNVPEMSGDFLIKLDGTIDFSVIGQVKAAGMTPKELKETLEKGLNKELRDPQVTVNVKQLRPVRIYIYGSVARPNVYDYRKGWRLTELISLAGGLSLPPERLSAIVFRVGSPTQKIQLRKIFIEADDTANIEVQPGDSINIQGDPSVRVNVIGEVKQSGVHEVYEGQGAVEAIAAASGETPQAALSRAKISRKGQDIPVDLYGAVINGDPSKNVQVMDGDTLYIPQQYARVAVSGTVTRPGSQVMPDGRIWTLTMAISEAGGVAPRGKTSGVQLVRVGADGKVKTTIYDLKKVGTKGVPDPVLQDKDLIFVPESGATNIGDITSIGNLYFILNTVTKGRF